MIEGFCVVERHVNSSKYEGIAKHVLWPLGGVCDSYSRMLAKEQLNRWLDNPRSDLILLEDRQLLMTYIRRCEQLGLCVKIFWLTTENPLEGNIADNIDKGMFRGWDYMASLDASYLYDDGDTIFEAYPEELSEIRSRMSAYGLFATKEDAQLYASFRRKFVFGRPDFEATEVEYFVALFDVSISWSNR